MLLILVIGLGGRLFWDPHMAFVASSPTNLPPMWVQSGYEKVGTPDHPLGTESNGRDMLSVLMVGSIVVAAGRVHRGGDWHCGCDGAGEPGGLPRRAD